MAENVRPTAALDAATQANAGESKVIGTKKERSATGAGDAASGLGTLRGNVANESATGSQFTRD